MDSMKKGPAYYQLTFYHFLDYPEQLAVRLQTHSSTGNLICHLIGTPLIGVSVFGLLLLAGGPGLALAEVAIVTALCFFHNLSFGIVYMIINILMSNLQLIYLPSLSLITCIGLLTVATFIQVVIGHWVFEFYYGEPELPHRGTGVLFSITQLVIDVTCGVFQFYSVLALKLGFGCSLQTEVNQKLHEMKEVATTKTK